ncbi:MAG: hypothetical protein DWC06_00580 [Candidatus Poseidoniales archaeon]|nr:MAG: hypothetical protein DWC06_00580 [Candidatus Poseidoniales archaeon]
MGLDMQRRWIALIALLCIVIPSISPLISNASGEDEIYEAGFVEWDVNNLHRIYISGPENDVNLTRDYQGAAMGNVLIRTGQSASVGPLSMPPLEMGFNGTFEISTYVAAYVQAGTGFPLAQCRTNNPVTIDTQVQIGDFSYSGSITEFVYESAADAHNMSTTVEIANITARPGDIITYSMSASTSCPASINIEWGGDGEFAGGIVIQGNLFAPEVEVTVDDSSLAHIQLVATLPWGFDDLDQDFTSMNIFGPVQPDEKRIYDEDMRPEGFTASSPYVERTDDMGRPSKVFTGKNKLPAGDNVLIVCLKTVDTGINGIAGKNCDHEGIIRFNVESEDEPMASAFLWLSISGFVAIIAYLVAQIRQGILLPLPLMAALVVMAILMIPLASSIPDLGGEEIVADDARAPSFILHQNGNGSVSLDELLDGKEAVIIGITLPASSNAVDQTKQIENAADRLGDRVSAVQIVTGENVRMDDLDTIAQITNASWPILIDDGESRFANRMPLGVSDSIVVIDSSGHVTYSAAGSASSEDIIEAVEDIGLGGQQSLSATLGLFWGPGLAMLLVALPRKKYELPEEPLIPGSLWGSVALAGGFGFLMVNFVSLVMAFIPGDNDLRTWVDLALVVWFVSAAIRAAMIGTPREVKFFAKKLHNRYSKGFREWRDIEDVERDLLIGFWMGWFIWLAHPALLPQGVAALTMTGGINYIFGPFMLLVHILVAGLLTLIIRFVASWGGSVSQAFGSFGARPFSQALGWALIPISLWALANGMIHAYNIGMF